ncbi:MAG: glycosyltransferase [Pseudomonadota bacterium]
MSDESADTLVNKQSKGLIQWNALAICIPTYKRNQSLENLLEALLEQAIPIANAPSVSILVIDNNPDKSAFPSVEKFMSDDAKFEVRYFHEARPGVVHVRNSALEQAGDVDAIAFIDDDELPGLDWIASLWSVFRESEAAVVWGAVDARYPENTPNWLIEGDFHSKSVDQDGPGHAGAATNNCLISLQCVRAQGMAFDPSLTLIGGEDIMFFDAMARRGELLFGTGRAVTHEIIPPERANLSWLRGRWRRTGLTDAIMISRRDQGWNKPMAAAQGLIRIGLASPAIALSWVISGFRVSPSVARSFYTFERGRGMVLFALGNAIEEYGRKT